MCDAVGFKQLFSPVQTLVKKLGKRCFLIVVQDHEGDNPCTYSVSSMATTIVEQGGTLHGIETPDQLIREFLRRRGLQAEH